MPWVPHSTVNLCEMSQYIQLEVELEMQLVLDSN